MKKYFWPDGVVRVSGREFTAMSESACYTKGDLSCLSCHSMHDSDANDQLTARMESNEACFQCHSSYRADIAAHTHHKADSAGSECYNCHMPNTAYGLLKSIRSHMIDSPTAGHLTERTRPNACNLCHLDQTLEWTADHLRQWYGQAAGRDFTPEEGTLAAGVLWILRGDAGLRAIVADQMRSSAVQQASGERWFAPFLARLLVDPYSAVRYIAARTVRTLPAFSDLRYDFIGPEEERKAAASEVIRRWMTSIRESPVKAGSHLLIDEKEGLNQAAFDRLWNERDDTLSFLSE
jgi:predicted CXXCH cytochrome family protein